MKKINFVTFEIKDILLSIPEDLNDIKIDWEKIRLCSHLKDAHIKIGIVSNLKKDIIDTCLDKIGIKEFISIIVSGDDLPIERHKPLESMYLYAIILASSSRNQTLIIETNGIGMEAAKKTKANILEINNYKECNTYKVLKEIAKIEQKDIDLYSKFK